MFKKIMIGCPVRDRAWILPSYLENLRRLDYPFDYLNYCFVINDCTDSTPELLTSFARERPDKVNLVVQNLGNRRSRNHRRGYYSFSDLAWLRNTLLTAFLKSNCDYLFSVDSDILVPPLSLSCLLEDNCAIVSALVCNGHEVGDSGSYRDNQNDFIINTNTDRIEQELFRFLKHPRGNIINTGNLPAYLFVRYAVINV